MNFDKGYIADGYTGDCRVIMYERATETIKTNYPNHQIYELHVYEIDGEWRVRIRWKLN